MMRFTDGLRTSATDEWTTPRDLFDELDAEFGFTLDVAATEENALCDEYYTRANDGLAQEWTGAVWCNPPYGREIGRWLSKAADTKRGGSSYASSLRAQTPRGGTSMSRGRRRFGSYAGGCGSARRSIKRRFRPRSSSSMTGREGIGGCDK